MCNLMMITLPRTKAKQLTTVWQPHYHFLLFSPLMTFAFGSRYRCCCCSIAQPNDDDDDRQIRVGVTVCVYLCVHYVPTKAFVWKGVGAENDDDER